MEITTTIQELLRVIKLTKAFTSKKETRPILQAVHIEANDNGKITFTATDSYKLVKFELCEPAATIKSIGSCNVDMSQLEKILRIFNYKTPVEINLTTSESKLFVSFEDYSFTLLLTKGDYPNIKNVIPTIDNYINESVRLSKENLLPILQALEKNHLIDIHINKNVNGVCLIELVNPINLDKTQAIIIPTKIN